MRHRIFPSLLSLSLALGLCVLPAAALETDDLKTLLQTYYVCLLYTSPSPRD